MNTDEPISHIPASLTFTLDGHSVTREFNVPFVKKLVDPKDYPPLTEAMGKWLDETVTKLTKPVK